MYMKLEATIISWEQSDRAYLGTLGDPLPESSNRGQVQLDEIQPVPSNEVLHQVEKTRKVGTVGTDRGRNAGNHKKLLKKNLL